MKISVMILGMMVAFTAHAVDSKAPTGHESSAVENEAAEVNKPTGGALVKKRPAKIKTVKKAKKAAKEDKKAEASPKVQTLADGLVIEDVKVGTGAEAKLGTKITVHYRGTFKDGKEFDSSYKSGEPVTFPLEEGGLIKGWTEGIPGMKVGGKRKLKVPYALAYGERGTPDGTIPPKTDLDFEVELKGVE